MQIFVNPINLHEGKSFCLDVKPSDTIGMVKCQIREKKFIPQEDQRLCRCGGGQFVAFKTVADYGIQPHSTLELILGRLRGMISTFTKTSIDTELFTASFNQLLRHGHMPILFRRTHAGSRKEKKKCFSLQKENLKKNLGLLYRLMICHLNYHYRVSVVLGVLNHS